MPNPQPPEALLWQDFNLRAIVATEIEFYLHGAALKYQPAQILSMLSEACATAGITLASAEQERGPDQYEVAFLPTADINQLAETTKRFKRLMSATFSSHNIEVDFSAKPLPYKPGSGLHVHVHLEDAAGQNVFFRDEKNFSPLLLNAIGGLLLFINPCMPVFAPTESSYARFAPNSNAPTTLSWGTNNRTVAIRLPTKPMDHKHLEHRVAGADANVAQVIAVILAGIHYGLTHKSNPGEPVYGDAALAQYGLPLIVRTLAEANECMKKSDLFSH